MFSSTCCGFDDVLCVLFPMADVSEYTQEQMCKVQRYTRLLRRTKENKRLRDVSITPLLAKASLN